MSYWFEWRSLSHRSEPLSRRIKRLRTLLTSTFRPFLSFPSSPSFFPFSPSCPLWSLVERERSSPTLSFSPIFFRFPLFVFLIFFLPRPANEPPPFRSFLSAFDEKIETNERRRDNFVNYCLRLFSARFYLYGFNCQTTFDSRYNGFRFLDFLREFEITVRCIYVCICVCGYAWTEWSSAWNWFGQRKRLD